MAMVAYAAASAGRLAADRPAPAVSRSSASLLLVLRKVLQSQYCVGVFLCRSSNHGGVGVQGIANPAHVRDGLFQERIDHRALRGAKRNLQRECDAEAV
jgi:hypothetical protein